MKDTFIHFISKFKPGNNPHFSNAVFIIALCIAVLFLAGTALKLWRDNQALMNTDAQTETKKDADTKTKTKKKKEPITIDILEKKQAKLRELLKETGLNK